MPRRMSGQPSLCFCPAADGSYLRLLDSCITQLKAQGPSRTCNESKEDCPDLVERESFGFTFIFGFEIRDLGLTSYVPRRISGQPAFSLLLPGSLGERCFRPWLVANRATLPQTWPPPPGNMASSCRWTETTQPTQPSIFRV